MERKYYAWLEVERLHFFVAEGRSMIHINDAHIQLVRDDYEKERKEYDFSKLIENYDENEKNSITGAEYILELFRKQEIAEMIPYFTSGEFKGTKIFYGKVKFPIEACMSGNRFYELFLPYRFAYWKNDNYPLKARVRGILHEEPFRKMPPH